jgi:hypothetical protein
MTAPPNLEGLRSCRFIRAIRIFQPASPAVQKSMHSAAMLNLREVDTPWSGKNQFAPGIPTTAVIRGVISLDLLDRDCEAWTGHY